MTEVWQKRVLWIAAAWNILGGISALIDPAKHFEQLYTSSLNLNEPLQLFFYRCVWINILGWGVAYLMAARLPGSRTPVFAGGGLGKAVYAGACFALYAGGRGTGALIAAAVFDLLLAALFALALFSRRLSVPAPAG
jgi:hypothetical protein